MPLYYFRIRTGRYSGASDHGTELASREAAFEELTAVFGVISRKTPSGRGSFGTSQKGPSFESAWWRNRSKDNSERDRHLRCLNIQIPKILLYCLEPDIAEMLGSGRSSAQAEAWPRQ
jgi:hypothetical protein